MLVLRHAQSTWNADGRWQGWADPDLSEEGVRQAQLGGSQLLDVLPDAWDAVRVSSDLVRARRTAEIVGASAELNSELQIDERLRERDVGYWSGLTRAEIEAAWPIELASWDAGELTAPPGGEERVEFYARIDAATADLLAAEVREPAVVVAHGGVIRAIAAMNGVNVGPVGHLDGWFVEPGTIPGQLSMSGPIRLLARTSRSGPIRPAR